MLPSFDGGFGMPALEAMSLGVPVIASTRAALPELVGGAGLLFDPADERAFAAALSRVSTDDHLARSRIFVQRATTSTTEFRPFLLPLKSRFTNRKG